MPQQYHAADPNSGLEVTVTGDFPDEPDDRVRIARTSNLSDLKYVGKNVWDLGENPLKLIF